MYETLLSPMKIGSMTVKNRTVMTAAEFSLGQTDGKPTERLMDYYEERAKGGVGMIASRAKVDILPLFIYKKAKVFRKNYIYVGNKFSLEEFYGRKDAGDEITEKIRTKLLETKGELISYLTEKGKIKVENGNNR